MIDKLIEGRGGTILPSSFGVRFHLMTHNQAANKIKMRNPLAKLLMSNSWKGERCRIWCSSKLRQNWSKRQNGMKFL